MKNKIVVCGDDHIRYEEPFYSAKSDYFDWFINQDFNNEHNIMIHVGDLFHTNQPLPKEYDIAYKYLTNLKFKKIYILAGNGIHEYNRVKCNYAIEPLNSIDNVELIFSPKSEKIGELNILFMPWVPSRFYNDKTMKEWYESWEDNNYDYIFGHFAHKPFFNTEIIIDHLKGKKRMGHIHIPDKEAGYVGVNTITRFDEKGIDCYLNIIDINDGKETYYDIPKFIDYYDIKYPDKPEEVDTKYPIWTIHEAPSKEKAEELYSNLCIRDIFLEKNSYIDRDDSSKVEQKQSITEYFDSFVKDTKINKEIEKILREVV
ncbi:MAG: hypothetical protein ACOC3V_00070 [bacterium]